MRTFGDKERVLVDGEPGTVVDSPKRHVYHVRLDSGHLVERMGATLRKGPPEFQSATEKDAFELSRVSPTELRMRLEGEKRIKVLMLALETTGTETKKRLLRKRLQQLCALENTAVTILFEPGEKDFSEWDLNAEGCVIDCRPCQATTWCGNLVMNFDKLKVGGNVIIFTHHSGKLTMNYRVKALTPGPAAKAVAA